MLTVIMMSFQLSENAGRYILDIIKAFAVDLHSDCV